MSSSLNQHSLDVEGASLRKIIASSGINLVSDGEIWKSPCPFHSDMGQSLILTSNQSQWKCDVCNTGGSSVEWVMKAEGVSKQHAQQLLSSGQSLTPLANGAVVKHSSVRRLDAPFDEKDDDQQILQHVINYYHETLKQSPAAMAYLKERGLDNSEVIEHFKLGFSDRTLGYRLPTKNRKEGAALRGRLQRLGIIKASGHELFRGSIVIPVIENGVIKQIYGRKVTQRLRPGTPLHCYLPIPQQGFINVKAIHTCEELIVCPSLMDALTFWCAGYKNVTCTYGVAVLSEEDLQTLTHGPVRRVLIAYAGTKEADTAANSLAEQLQSQNLECYRIEFPQGLDANAYALTNPPAAQSLGEVIRKAVWLGQGQAPGQYEASAVGSNPDGDLNQPAAETEALGNDSTEDCHATTSDSPAIHTPSEAMPEVLPATVLPSPATDIEAEIKDDEIVMCLEDRRYRVRGLKKNLCIDQLKVNVLVNKDVDLHVDTFDLYASRARLNFIKQTALELGVAEEVIKKDLGQVLLKLEVLQDQNIQQVLSTKVTETPLSKKDKDEAMGLLQSPDLLRRILQDYEDCGVIGEKTNKLVGYLAALSRKLDSPLAVIIQSTSAAGKSALMEAVLSFIPEEERVQYSAMTGQSLFYMGDINLKHKILAISEEEGASHATYALKILQSEGQLTIASTGKDPDSGRHVTREYRVEGPVMIFSTTTAIDIDEELLNRCLVLTVDEDRAQTRAIHDYQRFEETLEGLQASQVRDDILRVHRNAQRLIKPLKVVNPYAQQLTFLDDKTRTRRDHKKYLTLIRSIALLHQYQREVKKTYYRGQSIAYVEVTLDDIDMANQLAHEVLGRSLDELPPQTRNLLLLIETMVSERCEATNCLRSDVRFSRREIRAYTGWGDTQLKVHLKRLETMEYLLIHRGGRGRKIVYELLYNREGQDGKPFLMGLIDTEILKTQYDENPSGEKKNLSGLSRPSVGRLSGTGLIKKNTAISHQNKSLDTEHDSESLDTLIVNNTSQSSYRSDTSLSSQGGKSL